MARTDMTGERADNAAFFETKAADNFRISGNERLWIGSLVALPYVSYFALVVMLGLFIAALVRRGGLVMQTCARRGFGWLSAGMLLSACFALDKGEGFLQLTNFLPFFVMFGVMVTVPAVVANPFGKLEALAHWLLVTSIPISLMAIAEFIIKFEAIAPTVKASSLPAWLLEHIYEPDFGHRAHSVFSHPNMLSAHLAYCPGIGPRVNAQGVEYWAQRCQELDAGNRAFALRGVYFLHRFAEWAADCWGFVGDRALCGSAASVGVAVGFGNWRLFGIGGVCLWDWGAIALLSPSHSRSAPGRLATGHRDDSAATVARLGIFGPAAALYSRQHSGVRRDLSRA